MRSGARCQLAKARAALFVPFGSHPLRIHDGVQIPDRDELRQIVYEATNGVLNPGETCDDGNTEGGDGCPATCRSDVVEPGGADDEITEQVIPTNTGISSPATEPVISDVKPSKLTFGSAELAITISGSGFHSGSVIIFQGTTYTPSVNQAGTQLKVTIPTGNLSIGPYRITVSNGPGLETTKKRALEIY